MLEQIRLNPQVQAVWMGTQSPLSPHFCLPLLNPVFYYGNYQAVGNSKTKLENSDKKQINPLTPNDLQRRRAVSPLKIKIPSKKSWGCEEGFNSIVEGLVP
jgi:hypothetical protein